MARAQHGCSQAAALRDLRPCAAPPGRWQRRPRRSRKAECPWAACATDGRSGEPGHGASGAALICRRGYSDSRRHTTSRSLRPWRQLRPWSRLTKRRLRHVLPHRRACGPAPLSRLALNAANSLRSAVLQPQRLRDTPMEARALGTTAQAVQRFDVASARAGYPRCPDALEDDDPPFSQHLLPRSACLGRGAKLAEITIGIWSPRAGPAAAGRHDRGRDHHRGAGRRRRTSCTAARSRDASGEAGGGPVVLRDRSAPIGALPASMPRNLVHSARRGLRP